VNTSYLVVLLLALATGVLVLGRLDSIGLPPVVTQTSPTPAAATPTPARATATSTPARAAPTLPPVQAKPQRGDTVLEISEAELSERFSERYVGRSLGQTPLGSPTIERVQVMLRNGRVETNGSARLAGASVPFTSQMTAAHDSAGSVKVTVTDARAGGLPLPDSARAELEADLQTEMDRLLARQPMRVRSIEIEDGQLRAIGTT
jgi:hypothetical protein